jgi:hypothetical protein
MEGHRSLSGEIRRERLYQLAEQILEGRGLLPGTVAGDRIAVAWTARDTRGAVLFVGPRSDGGLQYHCVRAHRRDGRWSAYETDSDEWPLRNLVRPPGGSDPPFLVAGSVSERDESGVLAVVPGVSAVGTDSVIAEIGAKRDAYAVEPDTGAFVVVLTASGGSELMLSTHSGYRTTVPL